MSQHKRRRHVLYEPNTVVQASDREYIVDHRGNLRVLNYEKGDVRDSELYQAPQLSRSQQLRLVRQSQRKELQASVAPMIADPFNPFVADPEMPVVAIVEQP